MVTVVLPQLLSSLVGSQHCCADGAATVKEALSAVFLAHRALTSCVLTECGSLRPALAVFVDGEEVRDRLGLSDRLKSDSEIRVVPRLWPQRAEEAGCEALGAALAQRCTRRMSSNP